MWETGKGAHEGGKRNAKHTEEFFPAFPFLGALKDNPRRPFPLHVNVFTANHCAVVHVVSEWKRARLCMCLEMASVILTHSLGKPLYSKGIMNMGSESHLCFPKSVVLDSAGRTESYTSPLKGFGILIEEMSSCFALNAFRYLLCVLSAVYLFCGKQRLPL